MFLLRGVSPNGVRRDPPEQRDVVARTVEPVHTEGHYEVVCDEFEDAVEGAEGDG